MSQVIILQLFSVAAFSNFDNLGSSLQQIKRGQSKLSRFAIRLNFPSGTSVLTKSINNHPVEIEVFVWLQSLTFGTLNGRKTNVLLFVKWVTPIGK